LQKILGRPVGERLYGSLALAVMAAMKGARIVRAHDVAATADALEPGSTAALLIYENLWAAPLASAVRRSGGQLVASGRIPVQQLLAAAEAELAEEIVEELEAEALVAEVAAQIEADEEADAGKS
jgi:hypothetical protein